MSFFNRISYSLAAGALTCFQAAAYPFGNETNTTTTPAPTPEPSHNVNYAELAGILIAVAVSAAAVIGLLKCCRPNCTSTPKYSRINGENVNEKSCLSSICCE